MPDGTGYSALIGELSAGLQPVRPLASPWRRAALWCGAVAWVAAIFALFCDAGALFHRLAAAPDMWLSFAGALLTAAAAAWAAFSTSIPGRSSYWAMLPLPPLAAWLAASTAGCLRMRSIGWTQPEPHMHGMDCLYFIVMVAVPLAALLMWQIMRACPLRPALTASLAGLASAGAAAAVLTLIHPFDATYEDLLAHLAAVLLVVGSVRLAGARVIRKARL
jgi:hypothetical protein